MCWWVTGAIGGVCDANHGDRRVGVTVGDNGGDTLGTGATLGSVAGSKHLGGGIRFVLGGACGMGCKGLTGCAAIVFVVSARIVIILVSSLREDNCRCWGILFWYGGQVFYGRDDCIRWCDSWIEKIFCL